MPLRNLFKRNEPPLADSPNAASERGFSAVAVGVIPIDAEPVEHELSEIDDTGAFISSSCTVSKPAFWQTKSNSSLTSSNHRSILSESEPFSISRESFDSYRRSFDISARSPVISSASSHTRPSLDSSLFLSPSALSSHQTDIECEEDEEEEFPELSFEDVKLSEEVATKPAPKKRGLLARFGTFDAVESPASTETKGMGIRASPSFQLFGNGRKRGQSGHGAELRSIGSTPVVVVVGGE